MRSALLYLIVFVACFGGARADVLPCNTTASDAYAESPAYVQNSAKGGGIVTGVILGLPLGLVASLIGTPVGAVTGPLWLEGDDSVISGAALGFCTGLWTLSAFQKLGFHVVGEPVYLSSEIFGTSSLNDIEHSSEIAQ